MEMKKGSKMSNFLYKCTFRKCANFSNKFTKRKCLTLSVLILSLQIEKKALGNRRTHHIETRRDRHHYFAGCGSKDAFDDINLLQKLLQGPKKLVEKQTTFCGLQKIPRP